VLTNREEASDTGSVLIEYIYPGDKYKKREYGLFTSLYGFTYQDVTKQTIWALPGLFFLFHMLDC